MVQMQHTAWRAGYAAGRMIRRMLDARKKPRLKLTGNILGVAWTADGRVWIENDSAKIADQRWYWIIDGRGYEMKQVN